jgi:hypothetical protein
VLAPEEADEDDDEDEDELAIPPDEDVDPPAGLAPPQAVNKAINTGKHSALQK